MKREAERLVCLFQVQHLPCIIFTVKVIRGRNITNGWAQDLSELLTFCLFVCLLFFLRHFGLVAVCLSVGLCRSVYSSFSLSPTPPLPFLSVCRLVCVDLPTRLSLFRCLSVGWSV